MQYEPIKWQPVSCTTPEGNRSRGAGVPGFMTDGPDGSKTGDQTLTQTFSMMKSPRKQNSNTAGTVRTGIPFAADLCHEDALPRFYEQQPSDHSSPREIPLPEEESFRIFLNSRLSKHKASQALKEKIRSSIEHREI
ncbi:MAG: hypothetical protein IPJ82_16415 [Lewinellaceae bacterium]|nr:hypothetical protein [Lewinellaceae bacterium]